MLVTMLQGNSHCAHHLHPTGSAQGPHGGTGPRRRGRRGQTAGSDGEKEQHPSDRCDRRAGDACEGSPSLARVGDRWAGRCSGGQARPEGTEPSPERPELGSRRVSSPPPPPPRKALLTPQVRDRSCETAEDPVSGRAGPAYTGKTT